VDVLTRGGALDLGQLRFGLARLDEGSRFGCVEVRQTDDVHQLGACRKLT
jgi:hypothetical protein